MKKSITFYIAALLLSLMTLNIYCKSSKKQKKRNEVTQVLAVYLKPDSTDANFDILWRVVKDSVIVDTNDISKSKVFVDSSYYLEKRDTARNTNGTPKLDSTGKILLQPIFVYLPKTSVWDTHVVVDSARKKFDPFIKKDKKDTTAKK